MTESSVMKKSELPAPSMNRAMNRVDTLEAVPPIIAEKRINRMLISIIRLGLAFWTMAPIGRSSMTRERPNPAISPPIVISDAPNSLANGGKMGMMTVLPMKRRRDTTPSATTIAVSCRILFSPRCHGN